MMKRLLTVVAFLGVLGGIASAARLPGLKMHSAARPSLDLKLDFTKPGSIPGGVAFPGVAKPENGETITAIDYLPAGVDGQRLRIKVTDAKGNNHQVFPKIYDW